MSFPASFSSRCGGCDSTIHIDQQIEWSDEVEAYVHEGCVEADSIPSTPQACDVCWLTHPEGACDR